MPGKRKRDDADEGNSRQPHARVSGSKQIVEAKVHHGKQLLYRALKLAKGFERQKLSRRLKNAEAEKKAADVTRINAEIEALKNLDLHAASEIHIHKAILKEKALRESPLLPTYIPEKSKVNLNNATANITARLWASAPVKKVMTELMGPIRTALVGHAAKTPATKSLTASKNTGAVSSGPYKHNQLSDDSEAGDEDEDEDMDQDTFDVPTQSSPDIEADDEADGEDFAAFDDRVGGSSDDESLDLEAAKADVANRRAADLSLSPSPSRSASLSPSPSLTLSASGTESDSVPNQTLDDISDSAPDTASDTSPVPQTQTPKPKPSSSKPTPAKLPASDLFLPSLTSGYISASDESASDLDADAAPAHKNRRGQRARQKIWEAKYGAKAKHMERSAKKDGGRDQGWDMKRGARAEGDDARFRGRGRGGFGGAGARKITTGANMEDVKPRVARGAGAGSARQADARPNRAERRAGGLKPGKAKEKEGALHPSWEAARRAKEAKAASVGFAGTKVIFD